MARFALQAVTIHGTQRAGVIGAQWSPGRSINTDASDGTVHETMQHILEEKPMAEFTTRDLAMLSVLNGSTDVPMLQLNGTTGLVMTGGKAEVNAPGYQGGSVHATRTGLRGHLFATGIKWSRGSKAELSCKALFISSNGTAAAVTDATGALPALPTSDFGYVLTGCTVNGVTLTSVDSVDITIDGKFDQEFSQGLPLPTFIIGAGAKGAVEIRAKVSGGDIDLGRGTGAVSFVFTKLANGGGLGANTVTLTINGPLADVDNDGGTAGSGMTRNITVYGRFDGTNRPLTWAIA